MCGISECSTSDLPEREPSKSVKAYASGLNLQLGISVGTSGAKRDPLCSRSRSRPVAAASDPSNQSLPISNPVSGFAIWKLKPGG
jgi:hypothetical protein